MKHTNMKFSIERRSDDPKPYRKAILEMIKFLEEREHLFANFDLIVYDDQLCMTPEQRERRESRGKFRRKEVAVLEEINDKLLHVLKANLDEVKDVNLVRLICATFYNDANMQEYWAECDMPLFSALIVVFIANLMRKQFKKLHEPTMADKFRQIQTDFDELSYELIHECSTRNELQAHEALELNYQRMLCGEPETEEKLSLMDLAHLAKAQKFLSHSCCQHDIDERWKPGFKSSRLFFFFAFIFVFPVKWIRFKKRERFVEKVARFYGSPCSKYCLHTIFYCFYTVFYMIVLVFLYNRKRHFYIRETFLMLWQAAFVVELLDDLRKVPHNIIFRKHLFHYIRTHPTVFWQNIIILINIFFFVSTLTMVTTVELVENREQLDIFRFVLLSLSELFFYVSFVYSTIRMLRVFAVDAFFGAIIMTIRKMMHIVISFMAIFVAFWIIYAVCQISLSGTNDPLYSIPWYLFKNGAFEIFGEPADDLKEGTLQHLNCTNGPFDWGQITDANIQCFFRTSMIPLVLFVYLMVASILIVNILTTFVNQTYEDVDKYAHLHWKYEKFARLVEYEEKTWFPAPFSLVCIPIRAIVQKICGCCCSSKKIVPLREVKTPCASVPDPLLITTAADKKPEVVEEAERIPLIDDARGSSPSFNKFNKFAKQAQPVRPLVMDLNKMNTISGGGIQTVALQIEEPLYPVAEPIPDPTPPTETRDRAVTYLSPLFEETTQGDRRDPPTVAFIKLARKALLDKKKMMKTREECMEYFVRYMSSQQGTPAESPAGNIFNGLTTSNSATYC